MTSETGSKIPTRLQRSLEQISPENYNPFIASAAIPNDASRA